MHVRYREVRGATAYMGSVEETFRKERRVQLTKEENIKELDSDWVGSIPKGRLKQEFFVIMYVRGRQYLSKSVRRKIIMRLQLKVGGVSENVGKSV